jgi:uroporphyrin-3 C-methyltransferase
MAQEQPPSPPQDNAAEEAAGSEASGGEVHRRAGRGAYWLGGLALLLVLGAAGAGGYAYWLLDQRIQGVDRSLEVQVAERGDLQQALADLRTELEEVTTGQGELGDRADALDRRLSTVEEAARELRAKLEGGPAYWRLERIETLLVTADRLARLEGDPQAAYSALEEADRALRNLQDPGWLTVRKAVQAGMTRLEQLPDTDIPGITFRLDSLMDAALELPLARAEAPQMGGAEAPAEAAGEPAAPEGFWARFQAALGAFWTDVKELVRLRRSEEAVEPLLPPEEAGFLRHNLVLNLQAARLAALRGQPEVYKASLTEAADWVARYFDPESDAVNAMTRSLERLQGQSVSRALPALEEPLRTFRQVRKERGD